MAVANDWNYLNDRFIEILNRLQELERNVYIDVKKYNSSPNCLDAGTLTKGKSTDIGTKTSEYTNIPVNELLIAIVNKLGGKVSPSRTEQIPVTLNEKAP